MSRHFTREDIRMANQHTKNCSVSLASRGVCVTVTVRGRGAPVRTAKYFLVTALSADKTRE